MSNKLMQRLLLGASLLLLPMSMQTWAADKVIDSAKDNALITPSDAKKAEMKKLDAKKAEAKKAEMKKLDAKKSEVKKAEVKKDEVKKTAQKKADASKANVSKASSAKVDINTATVEQLTTINGIGKSKAQAIVDHRKANGKFKKSEDLMQVKGIGTGTLKKITPYISY